MADKSPKRGRPPVTSAPLIARAALDLFLRDGFESTTLDAVAAAAGVSKRTLFQYFPSKSAIVWHGAQEAYEALLTSLDNARDGDDWHSQVADALIASLQFPDDDLDSLQMRLQLIEAEPVLQGNLFTDTYPQLSAITYRISQGLKTDPDDLAPFVLARTMWVAAVSALLWWARTNRGDPRDAVRQALAMLEIGEPATHQH